MNSRIGYIITLFFLIFSLVSNGVLVFANVLEYQVDSTELQVYRDGLVRVTQVFAVNETIPLVTFPLLGSSADNFIVLDENRTVLDYEIENTNLTVLTLGTTSFSVQYDTFSLTTKDAEVWSLIVNTPYNLTALLPEDSTIVYLSAPPTSIETVENQILLSLFANQWEISYIFPLTPPANFQISNLEITPNEVQTGEEVTVSVRVTNTGGQAGSYILPLTVNQTVIQTKTVTLESGESNINEFIFIIDNPGTYTVEIDGLFEQLVVTQDNTNGTNQSTIPIYYLIVILVVVSGLILIVLVLLERRKPNIEKILKMHPRLNQEEKDVIQLLIENDAKAFEAEIREKFPNIPRTSLWRLIKRLETMGIVSIKKIGLENRVELK